MTTRLEVHPHRSGPWLVQNGSRQLAVPPALGRLLIHWQDRPVQADQLRSCLARWNQQERHQLSVDELDSLSATLMLGSAGPVGPGRRPRWQMRLVPRRWLGPVAGLVAPLAAGPVLVGQLVLGLAGCLVPWLPSVGMTWFPQNETITPLVWLTSLGLFLGTALWHEIGHAAALHREGYPPGGIGLGILLVLPVLFTDVTPVNILPRRGKIRVAAAGISFQVLAAGCLVAVGFWTQASGAAEALLPSYLVAALPRAGFLALVAAAYSLLPFVKLDGYWLLSDLLGLPDLEQPLSADKVGSLGIWLIFYRTFAGVFLVAVGILLPWKLISKLAGLNSVLQFPDPEPWLATLGRGLLVLLVAGLWWALGRRLRLLWRGSRADWARLRGP